jgi:hypothetical protein
VASRLRAQQEAVVEEAADLAAAVQARSAYVSVVGAPVLSTMDLALAGMCVCVCVCVSVCPCVRVRVRRYVDPALAGTASFYFIFSFFF